MASSLQQFVLMLPTLPLGVASIMGAVQFRRLSQPLRYLALSVVCAMVVQVIGLVLWAQKIPNLFLYPFYIFSEFALLAYMYRQAIPSQAVKRVVPLLIGAFGLYCLADLAWHKQAIQFNSWPMFVESLALLALVFVFFHRLITDAVVVRLGRYPLFWVSAGLLLYFAGNALIFVSSNYLLAFSNDLNIRVWLIHAVLCCILYSFYIVALCLRPVK
jgi:hypothetical protein